MTQQIDLLRVKVDHKDGEWTVWGVVWAGARNQYRIPIYDMVMIGKTCERRILARLLSDSMTRITGRSEHVLQAVMRRG